MAHRSAKKLKHEIKLLKKENRQLRARLCAQNRKRISSLLDEYFGLPQITPTELLRATSSKDVPDPERIAGYLQEAAESSHFEQGE